VTGFSMEMSRFCQYKGERRAWHMPWLEAKSRSVGRGGMIKIAGVWCTVHLRG